MSGPVMFRHLAFKCLILFLLTLTLFGFLTASGTSIRFGQISLDEGLSQNSVFCILQDSKGFLWFGTQDGLNKYDGYDFTVYKLEPGNLNSLSSNTIWCMEEDPSGDIWVGTLNGGLNRFNVKKEIFVRYGVSANPNADSEDALNAGFVNSIVVAPDNSIWVGTPQGLSKLRNGKFRHFRNIPGDSTGVGSDRISRLYLDRSNRLWVGTFNDGLKKYNAETDTFTHYRHISGDPHSLARNAVSFIFEDEAGTLWIGTFGGGVSAMDSYKGTFQTYRNTSAPDSLSGNDIRAIIEDRAGILWIGTNQNGLNIFNKRSETFTHIRNIPGDGNSLSHNSISSLFEDSSRVLWAGTPGKGLNKFDRQDYFSLYRANPDTSQSISDNFVYGIYEDGKGVLWVGTNGFGLDRYDRLNRSFNNFRNVPGDDRSLSNNLVRTLLQDSTGTLWAGTEAGLNRMDSIKGVFRRFFNRAGDPTSLSQNMVRALYEDSSGVLWVGTRNGLNKYNRQTETFSRYNNIPGNSNSLSSSDITCIYEPPTDPGILWVGTRTGGLNRLDTVSGKVTRYRNNPADPGSLSLDGVLSVYQDSSGTMWICTYGGGINKALRGPGGAFSFTRYTEQDGLANNSTYGILEDRNGHLWISTNRGISRLDPKTEKFRNYTAGDGLQGNEFNSNAYFKSRSGEMFFGGINGINAFFPHMIKDNPNIPPIVITGFRLFNKPVPIAEDSVLKQHISYTDTIYLSHRQDSFTFYFSALDYTIPEKNQYAYIMEGLEEQWNYTGFKERLASYTNMPSGEYRFRVIGSNNDGVWNMKGTSIQIIIGSPFWATWWFRSLTLLVLAIIVMLLFRNRLKNTRLKAELQTARDAQMSIMPQSDPDIISFDISGICQPAYEVGGDFFDYIWMNEEKTMFGIAVGDVSGKAMKSAMTAVMTSGMIYLKTGEAGSVREIMRCVNRPLYFKTNKNIFTALCLASIEIPSKELTFTNAGLHEPLFKSGQTGSVSLLEGVGDKLPLGVKKDTFYMEKKKQLVSGDLVVFYTDGISEAKNPAQEFYGVESLKQLLQEMDTATLDANSIKERIIYDVEDFASSAPQHDDITIVVVKVLQ